MKKLGVFLLVVCFTMGLSVSVQATAIDLNDFFADPTVTVAVDGSSAEFAEDPGFFSVLLSNDPGFDPPDPPVLFAGPDLQLIFNFEFDEALGEDDEFGAFVLDPATGLSFGPAFEFFTDATGSGEVAFDLSPLPPGLGLIGLQFQLSSLFADTGFLSTALVSNVRIVPEPGSLLLFSAGFGTLLFRRRRSKGQAASAS